LPIRRIVFAHAALVAALLVAQAAGPSRASASRVSCGETIMADTVLRADVTGCAGAPIVIGADGVSLDLDGHTVDGSIVASGHTDLQVRDGIVAGDVRFDRARRVSVRRVRVRHGSITCVRTAGCAILHSVVTAGGIAIFQTESGVPNRVRGNVVRGAPGAGIAADRTDTTSITGNVVRDSATGIETSHAADLRIARNLIVHSSGDGVSGSFGSTASIVRNVIVSNEGDGVSLRIWGGQTLIAANVVSRNGRNGILGAAVAHWIVTRNLAAGNGRAGIAITGAVEDVTLARNRALRNGELGIDAARGVTDAGGNSARANGTDVQCAGIAC
jgi:hypothetical protein